MVKCEDCNGSGQRHNFKITGIQMTADMKEKLNYYKCEDCRETKLEKQCVLAQNETGEESG